MGRAKGKYVYALYYQWLTPLYDPLVRWLLREDVYKNHLVEQADIGAGQWVLDLGCGTGTLLLLIKRAQPNAQVVGLDGDPKALAIAAAKAGKAQLDVRLDEGLAYELPYGDGAFDRVLSSFVFHHLAPEHKRRALREVFRVLRPGGELHVADWGRPHSRLMRLASYGVLLFEGLGPRIRENLEGRLPELFRQAGFFEVEESAQFSTVFGTLALYRSRKPA